MLTNPHRRYARCPFFWVGDNFGFKVLVGACGYAWWLVRSIGMSQTTGGPLSSLLWMRAVLSKKVVTWRTIHFFLTLVKGWGTTSIKDCFFLIKKKQSGLIRLNATADISLPLMVSQRVPGVRGVLTDMGSDLKHISRFGKYDFYVWWAVFFALRNHCFSKNRWYWWYLSL